MALLHRAELRPTKLELLDAWLPTRKWYRGPAAPGVQRVATFRFDDPEGEVGVETLLVRAGDGPLLQVPLTYRGAPLPGGEPWLVGTTEHSVLGPRWVYDACGDPVYASVLAHAILTGGTQAEEYFEADGRREVREPSVSVRGSGAAGGAVPAVRAVLRVEDGDPTLVVTDTVELSVARVLDEPGTLGGPLLLTGTWTGGPGAFPLAAARLA